MSISLPSLAFIAPIVLFGAGCAYNDRVDNRVSTYDIAAERARDEMILTNIIRASHAEPLAFVQLGQVTGSAAASGQLGLPSVVLGPPATSAATQVLQQQAVFGANAAAAGFTSNSVAVTGSTLFNVTPSETKEFYQGLLLPVTPQTLEGFVGQGIARELLFYLFTEKIIEEKAGATTVYRNDPNETNFPMPFPGSTTPSFQYYVELAWNYGLSAEEDPYDKKRLEKEKKGTIYAASATGNESEKGAKAVWRLCFDPILANPKYPNNGNRPRCRTDDKMPGPQAPEKEYTVTFPEHPDGSGAKVSLIVQPRSTFAIFQFLGRLVAEERGGEPIELRSAEAIGERPFEDHYLFVLTGGSPGDCFLDVSYDGQNYCVPDNAFNTKRILSLLAQLLALNTSVNEIPTTPQVQVVP